MKRNREKEETLKRTAEALGSELALRCMEVLEKEGFSEEERENFQKTFQNCFVSTANTTTHFSQDGEAYVFTGDIEAMWLRDSSAQIAHYLPFAKEYPIFRELAAGLLARQFRCIVLDPYANAFNEEENGRCWAKDETDSNDWEWERKYEVDSLCYPLWLLHQYVSQTGDRSVLTETTKRAFLIILDTWETEQRHGEQSGYFFIRKNCPPTDTLPCEGRGEPTAATGMTWSGFRPSDDACRYGYLVPSNMFAAVVLGYLAEYAEEVYREDAMAARARKLKKEIEEGIEAFALRQTPEGTRAYVYETDGMGHEVWMDDANVPNLLSLPWLGWCSPEDARYQNTRAWILSKRNPYYYEGTRAKGIGSPHTPKGYIWHIALTMQGLTSTDRQEQTALLRTLLQTDGGMHVMHEGFDANAPEHYTRDWFAWANSLFALYALTYCGIIG